MEELNTLSFKPGDVVQYILRGDYNESRIEQAGWQTISEDKKQGKIWTYWMTNGDVIPHSIVTAFLRSEKPETPNPPAEPIYLRQSVYQSVSDLDISAVLKTAICCLIQGTDKDLEVAHHLIGTRIREINELKKASLANDASGNNQ